MPRYLHYNVTLNATLKTIFMKKIATFLLLLTTCIGLVTKAQPGTVCNAQFTTTISALTAQCTPTVINTSTMLQHKWQFGDGGSSVLINPSHTYASGGVYTIKHFTTYRSPNDSNLVVCTDSFSNTITLLSPTVCTIRASFNFLRDSIQTNTVLFTNTSTSTAAITSYRWNFGDGTFSTIANPIHTYAASGLYTVCLTAIGANNCVDDTCRAVQIQVPNTCTIAPNFTTRQDSIFSNKVYFTNVTQGYLATDSISWSFGDGGYSTEVNPAHTYNQLGTYTVCLRVKRMVAGSTPCVREYCRTIVLTQITNCNIQANFYQYRDTSIGGTTSLNYHFENTTAPFALGDSTIWNFGDGTILRGVNYSPNHVYANAGTYTVCLIVKRKLYPTTTITCTSDVCHTLVIEIPCNYTPYFTFSRDSSTPATNVFKFTNATAPVNTTDSISWNFGDGSPIVNNVQNPLHTFINGGVYTVCLTVNRRSNAIATGYCTKTFCKIVTVIVAPPACNVYPNFNWRIDSTIQPVTRVNFTNTTFGLAATDSSIWNFGDGTILSTFTNPSHTYSVAGIYTVCLRVARNNSCIKDTCIQLHIIDSVPPNPCNFEVSFTKRIDSNNTRKAIFTNTTNIVRLTTTTATWSYGDGTGSTYWNGEHTYAQAGRYLVCVTINNGANCVKTNCDSITITGTNPTVNCDSVRLGYTYRRDSYMPNKYYFFAFSNRAGIANQKWTITKLPANGLPSTVITANNPVYVFTDTGYYNVCLNALVAGCQKQYCNQIRVTSNVLPTQCVLQTYPNPAHNNVNINVQLNEPQLISVYIYNAQNILVGLKTQQGFTGNNLINMNISILTQGFYTLRIVHGNKVCYSRFMKI